MMLRPLTDLVDRDNVGMIQIRGRLGLNSKPLNERGRRQFASQDHFQGHQPVRTTLPCLENNSHSAATDPLDDLVIAEGSSLVQRNRGGRRGFFWKRSKAQFEQAFRTMPKWSINPHWRAAILAFGSFWHVLATGPTGYKPEKETKVSVNLDFICLAQANCSDRPGDREAPPQLRQGGPPSERFLFGAIRDSVCASAELPF